jgi:hypothetical protein
MFAEKKERLQQRRRYYKNEREDHHKKRAWVEREKTIAIRRGSRQKRKGA